MNRRKLGTVHRLNQWDEIAKARAASRDDSPWYAVWLVIVALVATLAVIVSLEREHDERQAYYLSREDAR